MDRLRLPRPRALRARGGAPLQSEQAAPRPLCEGACRRAQVGARGVRLHDRRGGRGPVVRQARQRAVHAQVPGRRSRVHLDARQAPGDSVGAHDRVRGARARLDQAASARSRGAPRHRRGAGAPGDRRVHQEPRRHRGRAPAHPRVHRRQPPARARADELLGLQHHRLLRGEPALLLDGRRRGVQADGGAPARRRPRGDPGRGLQPHRRGQRARPDPVLQGHRQCLVLPLAAGCAALLHQRHRHRQHGEPEPPARAPDGHGQPALLGDRDARRRLPLRPRDHPRPGALWLRRGRRLPRYLPAGPGAEPGEADRGAMGLRAGRLPGRLVLAGLGGVERPLPGHRARLLARRRGQGAGARVPPRGIRGPVQQAGPAAVGERQLRHRARRLHAERPRVVQRQAQRGQWRGQSRRQLEQPVLELRRRGADRRSRHPRRCASGRSAIS